MMDLPNSTQNHIANAQVANKIYREKLADWHEWLEEDPMNPLKVILYELIDDMLKKRGEGGIWENEDRLPDFETLDEALDKSKLLSFERKINRYRDAIEDAALSLIDAISSPLFFEQFEQLEYDRKLEYANHFIDQLSASNAGKLYIIKSINAPLTTPIPIFHPEYLLKEEGNFLSDDFPVMRRAAKTYVHYFINLVPALMADYNISRFISLAMNVILKYHPTAVLGDIDEVVDNILEFEALLVRLRDFHEQHPEHLRQFGGSVAGAMLIFVEVANLYVMVGKLHDNPNARNTFGVLKSLAQIRLALHNAHRVLRTRMTKQLTPSRVALLSTIVGLYDVAIRAVDVHEAWRTNDLSVAAGHALEAVGIGTAATIATWNALVAAGVMSESMAINPLAGAFLTLGALLVTFVGSFLVAYTEDPDLEKWFEFNYFGSKWDRVNIDEDPDSGVLFRWKRVDGTPDLARQISDYLSIFNPLRVQIEPTIGVSNPPESYWRFIWIRPALAYHGSHVVVKRIIDAGWMSDPPRYTVVTLYEAPMNTNQDLFPNGDRRNIFSPLNPQENDRLLEWGRLFSSFNPGLPPTDPTGHYLEIDVTIGERMLSDLAEMARVNPDVLDGFPIVLRQRVRIE